MGVVRELKERPALLPAGRVTTPLGTVLVFALALLAFVPGIGRREIWTRDEARTALVIREMLETGEWSLARMPGGVPSKKPPLYHWLAAVISRRALDETTLRLPAAFAGAGTAALTYLLGAQLATPAVGLTAAAILVASPAFFEWARVGRMETLLAFGFTLSLWGIGRWLRQGGLGNGLVFGIGLGLAMLTKGPVGLLPVPVAALGLLTCRSRPGRARELVPGLALAAAMAITWLGLAALTAPDFADHAGSVAPTIAGELARPSSPIRSGVMTLVIGFLPWTLLLPGGLVLLGRRRPDAASVVMVALWWLAVVLFVFLFVVPTRSAYFVPAYPALALIAAWCWQTAEGRERRLLSVPLGVGVAAAIGAFVIFTVWPTTIRFHGELVAVPVPILSTTIGVLLVLALVAARLEGRGARAAAVVTLAGGVVAILLALELGVRVPFDNQLYPIRAAVKQLEAQIPPGAEVGYLDAHRVISLVVYLPRPLKQLPPPKPGNTRPPPLPDYVVLLGADFQDLAQRWALERVDEVVIRDHAYVLAKHARPGFP